MTMRLTALAAILIPTLAHCAGLQICRRFYVGPLLPRDYIEDGLTHYWDAEFNVSRTTHATTNVWNDLVGDKNLTLLPNDLVKFTAHSAKFGYSTYWEPTRDSGMFVCDTSIPLDEIKTVEVCALFSKGYGFLSAGECDVMFSNGATERSYRSSALGDKYCIAPCYLSLTWAADFTYLGAFARYSGNGYVGYTSWNASSGAEGQGAAFQNHITGGFTISGCVTNTTDAGGMYASRFWRPDALVNYWGSSKTYAYTNNYAYTYGVSSPYYYTPTDPVGTGLSVGGVRFNGGQYSLFYGYIYAIRVYNRRLEMWERQHNADIDYQAFKGKKE